MLFKVHHQKDFHELNPEASAIEEFGRLTSRQMMAVALIADYESPFRTLPEKERRTQAAKAAGYNLEADGKRLDSNGRSVVDKKVGNIEAAIFAYREMQYDQQKDMLEATDTLIQETIEMMKMDKTDVLKKRFHGKDGQMTEEFYSPQELTEKSVKLAKSLPELRKTKQEILNTIQRDNEVVLDMPTIDSIQPTDDSDQPLSTLDMIMAKKQANGSE